MPQTQQIQEFLADPKSYPHHPESVELVQTHASWVALVPPFVYKVKKPVDFGFLDFSTLEKQRHFCEEEIRLNRRLCSDLYDSVVAISEGPAGLYFGDGQVVAYAVKMNQLEDGRFLNQLIYEVTVDDLDRVIEKLVDFYQAQEPRAKTAKWGRIEALKVSTDENFDQTEAFIDDLLPASAFYAVKSYTNRFYDHQARLLNERRAGGRILDCHGDLHLEHIHLTPSEVSIYDCIEFNERLRYIDIASDIAFLCMDLDHNGRFDLSGYLARGMAERLQDPDLLKVLDFYKCYRAYVRAKVESIKSTEAEVEEEDRRHSRDEARRYYRLALRYATSGSGPLVIVVMGSIGTGKSTTAHALREALGWKVFSSDQIRKERAGRPVYERTAPEDRPRLYDRDHSDQVYYTLIHTALERSETGLGTILDATFGKKHYRDALRDTFRAAELPYVVVELTAPDAVVKRRLRARVNRKDVISDARLEDFEPLKAAYEAPDDLEDPFHFTVSSELDAGDIAGRVLVQTGLLFDVC